MDHDRINRIANILDKDLEPDARQKLLETLASDDTDLELLSAALIPESRGFECPDVPFPCNSFMRLGGQGDVIRIFEKENIRISNGDQSIAERVTRISGDTIPICFKDSFSIEVPPPTSKGQLEFRLDSSKCHIKFNLEPDHKEKGDDLVEIWEDGAPILAFHVKSGTQQDLDIKAGSVLTIRFSQSPWGMAIRFSKMKLQKKDWVGASLTSAFRGKIQESISIITHRFGEEDRTREMLKRIQGLLTALSAATKIQKGLLFPAPAFRSAETASEDLIQLLQPVWTGITSIWPEAEKLSNSWSAAEPEESDSLSPSVLELAQTTASIARGSVERLEINPDEKDPETIEGWRGLMGWFAISRGEYNKAFQEFTLTTVSSKDPFSIQAGKLLAERLESAEKEQDLSPPDKEEISEKVWKEIFLLDQMVGD